jgi:L-iditol 2-dehydrogenase
MRACALVAPQRLALVDAPSPPLGPHDVRIRPRAVGVCGTDLHIFAGESNFHFDAEGRAIPLEASPQILGHEIAGEVVEVGAAVRDLAIGARVVVDQGRNCRSERRAPVCEYCATGHSHQCAHYTEHGITGLPGKWPIKNGSLMVTFLIALMLSEGTYSRTRSTSRKG